MVVMLDPLSIVRKIESYGSESLNHSERVFVVEVFRAAALTQRPEVMHVKDLIQKAHLEYCLKLTNYKKGRTT
jgi:hypothetical protein